MGINLGAFLCAFVCGTLGEKVGWHWGFGSAAVGMLLGLGAYLLGRPAFLQGVGEAPRADANQWSWRFLTLSIVLASVFGLAVHVSGAAAPKASAPVEAAAAPAAEGQSSDLVGLAIILGVVLGGGAAWAVPFIRKNAPEDRGPVISILLFMLFNVFFWLAFEQAGSSINKFTESKTDRVISWLQVPVDDGQARAADASAGPVGYQPFEVPATWFQSVNAGLIFLLAPLFSALWTWLGRHRLNPSQPMKIALGLFFLGVGYLFTVWAGVQAAPDQAKAAMWLILMTYFWHTVGELCLSPTGLSYVTKAAPRKYVSLLMGLWFVSSFIANLAGGLIAAKVESIERGETPMPWSFGGRADFFFLFVISSFTMAAIVFALTPLLKKLMRQVAD
jgi:POT family proton-dependent oligopeptide transporter